MKNHKLKYIKERIGFDDIDESPEKDNSNNKRKYNISGDDLSYMNDELDKKRMPRRNELPWYNDDSTNIYDMEEEIDDFDFTTKWDKDYRTAKISQLEEEEEERDYSDEEEEELQNLIELLYRYFDQENIDEVVIDAVPGEIEVVFKLKYLENLSNIVKIFNSLNKLQNDTLYEYFSEISVYSFRGRPHISVTFTDYSDGYF